MINETLKYNNKKCNKRITIKEDQKNFNTKLINIIKTNFNNSLFIQYCIIYDKLILDNNKIKIEINFNNDYSLGSEKRFKRNDLIINYLFDNFTDLYLIETINKKYSYRINKNDL